MTTPSLTRSLLIVMAWVAGCGARTPLSGLAEQEQDASVDASADAAIDAPMVKPDALADQEVDDAALPPPICKLTKPGVPLNLAPSPSAQSYTPSIVALSAGDPFAPKPPHVVVSWLRSQGDSHPTTVARDFEVGPVWPDDMNAKHEPVAVGPDSHTWNELALAPDGHSVSLVWWDDPGMVGRLRFRTLDVANWTMADPVDLTSQSSEALGLVAGAGLGEPSGYGGDGYGLLWRVEDYDTNTSVPAVAVLDSFGQIVMGPHYVTAVSANKRTPAIAWSGTTYLMATAFGPACEPGDSLCQPSSVVISRIRPPSGDAWDDSGVEVVHVFPALPIGDSPRRPSMVSRAGKTYVVWFEGPEADAGEVPLVVRVAELHEDGTMAQQMILSGNLARPVSAAAISILPPGLAIAWPEAGEPEIAPYEPGASRLRILWLDASLKPLEPEATIDITRFYSWGSKAMVSLDWPRGVLLVWTGQVKEGNSSQVHAVRLGCE